VLLANAPIDRFAANARIFDLSFPAFRMANHNPNNSGRPKRVVAAGNEGVKFVRTQLGAKHREQNFDRRYPSQRTRQLGDRDLCSRILATSHYIVG